VTTFGRAVSTILFAFLTACGGSDDGHLIAPVEIDATSKQAMAGDWPIARYNIYIAQDQPNWEAVWSERLLGIDCLRQFNAAACASRRTAVALVTTNSRLAA